MQYFQNVRSGIVNSEEDDKHVHEVEVRERVLPQ